MIDHCILFGHGGHLAQTRVIPQLEKRGISYTGVSRSSHTELKDFHHKKHLHSCQYLRQIYLRQLIHT